MKASDLKLNASDLKHIVQEKYGQIVQNSNQQNKTSCCGLPHAVETTALA